MTTSLRIKPQQLTFIDESVGADALPLAETLEGVVGVQRLLPYLELLPVSGGMEPFGMTPIDVRQVRFAHQAQDFNFTVSQWVNEWGFVVRRHNLNLRFIKWFYYLNPKC